MLVVALHGLDRTQLQQYTGMNTSCIYLNHGVCIGICHIHYTVVASLSRALNRMQVATASGRYVCFPLDG